jgi:hypothetical protein
MIVIQCPHCASPVALHDDARRLLSGKALTPARESQARMHADGHTVAHRAANPVGSGALPSKELPFTR